MSRSRCPLSSIEAVIIFNFVDITNISPVAAVIDSSPQGWRRQIHQRLQLYDGNLPSGVV